MEGATVYASCRTNYCYGETYDILSCIEWKYISGKYWPEENWFSLVAMSTWLKLLRSLLHCFFIFFFILQPSEIIRYPNFTNLVKRASPCPFQVFVDENNPEHNGSNRQYSISTYSIAFSISFLLTCFNVWVIDVWTKHHVDHILIVKWATVIIK